ncbi:MAG: LysM peptidoglycan-binding domain-containing protein [Bacillota bacterium]|nr:LysM peptidoglycan-binding domain-containing protein [Bacillota bacterium]
MHRIMRHSLIPGLALIAALALSVTAAAAPSTDQGPGLKSLAHPSFRAGQNGQVYYRGTPDVPREVVTGPASLDWQALYEAQMSVNQGNDAWRLDPVQVARVEGVAIGFSPSQDTYTLISRADLQQYVGTGAAQVLVEHSGRAYLVQLIQPFGPGQGLIWTINSVREITSPDEANRIARQAWITFRYRSPYGPAVAAWWNESPRPPQAPPVQSGRVYYVQPGDTLWAISVRNGVTLYRLIQLNPNVNANALWVGQVIIVRDSGDVWTVPGSGSGSGSNAGSGATSGRAVHIVEPGDTLWRIALKYNASVEAIMNTNGIADANTLWVGQRLIIP